MASRAKSVAPTADKPTKAGTKSVSRAVMLIAIVVSVCTSILAAYLAGNTAVPNTLYATEADMHLGESFQGQTLDFAFELNNGTDVALHIVDVEPGCTCTTGQLEKTTLMPGESTSLRTTWEIGAGKRGELQERVFVFFSTAGREVSPDSPAQVLQLSTRTRVIPDFDVTPETLTFAGNPPRPRAIPVSFNCREGVSARVLSAATTHRAFSASQQGDRTFAVAFDPAKWDGRHRTVEVIFVTDSPNEPEIRIPIFVGG